MRAMIFSAVLALMFILASTGHAVEAKVGVIDMQRALNDTQEGKKALQKLKGRLEAETQTMKSKQEELKKMEEELNQQGYMLSDSARSEKQEKLKRQFREFEKYRDEKGKEFMGLQKEATEKILKKLLEKLKEYAKAEGYTVILESSQQSQGMPGSVVWYENRLDITDKIIELYDKAGAPEKE